MNRSTANSEASITSIVPAARSAPRSYRSPRRAPNSNPMKVNTVVEPGTAEGSVSAWDQFRQNDHLRRIHNVSNDEMNMLSQVALLGEVQSPRDLVFILNTVRHAVGR
jgi:ribosomal protein S10